MGNKEEVKAESLDTEDKLKLHNEVPKSDSPPTSVEEETGSVTITVDPKKTEELTKEDTFKAPMFARPAAKKSSGQVKIKSADKMKPPPRPQVKSNMLPSAVYKPYQPALMEEKPKAALSFKMGKQKLAVREEISDELNDEKPKKAQLSKPKLAQVDFNYELPGWSSENSKEYLFEVLKGGAILCNLSLKDKSHVVFGRLKPSDIILEHPSISRHHAVLQYGSPTETDDVELQKDGTFGWYIYDFGSTHGTFVNKARVKPKTYYRVKVGHMVKFATSTRMYILQGPEEDEEMEAKETVTELKEKARADKLEKESLHKRMMGDHSSSDEDEEAEKKKDDNSASSEPQGISWGMLEDAVSDGSDEEDDKVDPNRKTADGDLLGLADKNRFYNKDPHKALKHFFEQEGMELEFECVERRSGKWTAKVVLPITSPTGKTLSAEVTLTGKKVQAITNCSLEACQLLDKHGMFDREKSGRRKKKKKWEKDDFYDSDEDCFLDRTGDLDLKRKQRKMRYGKSKEANGEKAETFESLTTKIHAGEKEIADIEFKLEKDRKVTKVSKDDEDSLQAFMRNIKEGRALDTNTRSKLKAQLINLRKEVLMWHRLAELARPVSMPALESSIVKPMSLMAKMQQKRKQQALAAAAQQNVVSKFTPMSASAASSSENVVEEDSDEEEEAVEEDSTSVEKSQKGSETTADSLEENPAVKTVQNPVEESEVKSIKMEVEEAATDSCISPSTAATASERCSSSDTTSRYVGPAMPEGYKRLLEQSQSDIAEKQNDDASKKKRKRIQKQNNRKLNARPDDNEYAGWMPPEGQTGDGKTKLNERFGY